MAPQFKWFEVLSEVCLIEPVIHEDARGFFTETYNASDFAAAGISLAFVQDNHSLSEKRGTIRGMHYQTEPFEQAKLVRCVRGEILDVVVDIRPGSQTFGHYVSAILSESNHKMLYVPTGFAHGFCTLTERAEVTYKVSAGYSPAHDRGIDPFDPELEISWPVSQAEAVLSEKDRSHPSLKQAFAEQRAAV